MPGLDTNIELRSQEIQEILGKIPPWLIRRGIVVITIVIILLIAGAAWFKYPDRIISQIQLTTDHPPVYLVARTTAKISEFFVQENQEVNEGELLVVLESSADYKDILKARQALSALPGSPGQADTSLLTGIQNLGNLELGSLQGSFAGLQKSIQSYLDFIKFDKYEMRIQGLEKELRNYRIHYDRLYTQRVLKEDELKIGEKQYNRMKELHGSGTISDLEFESAEQQYLSLKYQMELARSELSNTSITMGQKEQQLDELKISKQEDEYENYSLIIENKDKFLGELADWELKYLMVSPIQGQISLSKFWSVNQEVKEGSRVLAIVREENDPILGKVILPNIGAGKVKPGQPVIIKFDRYPHMEFGMVSGVVNSISRVPDEASYYVEVGFPGGLNTSYDKSLEFTQEMTGQAEIITEDRSFLVRIISPLKSLLKRNTEFPGSASSAEQ